MFIHHFKLKTKVQSLLFNLREVLDFPHMHPAREMNKIALQETVDYVRQHMMDAIPLPTARQLLEFAIADAKVDGHFMEFGVYWGSSIKFIARRIGSRQIHGFDSFGGLGERWSGNASTTFDTRGRLPKVPRNVALHKGLFSDSLPRWLQEHSGPIAFAHIDCDIYGSTKSVFDAIGPRIVPGTIIVFDEYFNYPNWKNHEFKAFQEFVATSGAKYEYLYYARIQAGVRITAR
jgi:predicted O-methyltransferase YrrM